MSQTDDFNGIFSGKTIIIAEDLYINREILAYLLEKTGISTDFVEDGFGILNLFVSNPSKYNLILTDIDMPEMDGYEAARLLRRSDYGKNIPIVAMTAKKRQEDIDKCFASGMNDHLAKPVDIEALIDVFKKWLFTANHTNKI